MTATTTLYTWTHEGMRLTDAISATASCMLDAAIGLFYSPQACRFGLYREGDFKDEHDEPLDLGLVFETRIFTEQSELRWWNDPERGFGQGKAAYLSESTQGPDGWASHPIAELLPEANHYLLWGEFWQPQLSLADGWSALAAGRIGTLRVPFAGLRNNQRLQLLTIEYFGLDHSTASQDHGNVVVIEERLVKLVATSKEGAFHE
jgi:CRISPR-associated protein (TIGR03984 family)